MLQAKDDEVVRYVSSEAGFTSLRIDKGMDHLIYNQRYRHGGRTSY